MSPTVLVVETKNYLSWNVNICKNYMFSWKVLELSNRCVCIISELFNKSSILKRKGIPDWNSQLICKYLFWTARQTIYICFSQKSSKDVGDNLLTNLCNETADYMMVSPLDK